MKAIIYMGKPNARRIKFYIPYQRSEWRAAVKTMNTTWYHMNQKLWSIINTPEHLDRLRSLFLEEVEIVHASTIKARPHIPMNSAEQAIIDEVQTKIILKGYSNSTLQLYKSELIHFLIYHRGQHIANMPKEKIEAYILKIKQQRQISESKQNCMINAIKFYYEQCLGYDKTYYNLQRPKKSQTLPNVLSQSEIKKLLQAPKNLKHRTILALIYSGGLRLGEVIKLRIEDIHSDDGYIFIKGAKGSTRRMLKLSV